MSKEKSQNPKPQKTKSRGNGEGSIYKRSDGRWCGAITVGRNENGTPKKHVLYGKSRTEVAEKMNKELNAISNGTYVDVNNITISSWLDTWLFEYKKQSLRPTTFESYEGLSRVHIKPILGHIKLKDLRAETIQKFYNDKFNSGLSPKTIKLIHGVLHEALKQALRNNLVIRNVSEATTLPRQVKAEIKVLDIETQNKFIDAIQNERLKALFLVALATGLRKGEILALKWNNVDLKKGLIHVKESVKRIKTFDENSPTKTTVVFQEPKTKSGIRTVSVPGYIVSELKIHKKKQAKEILIAGELYQHNNLVFCTEIGKPIEARNLSRRYMQILDKAKIKGITFHALRHTYATRLLEANEHPKTVQELLGHSDISLTLNTYSHVMPEIKIKAASKINHLFAPRKKQIQNQSHNQDD